MVGSGNVYYHIKADRRGSSLYPEGTYGGGPPQVNAVVQE